VECSCLSSAVSGYCSIPSFESLGTQLSVRVGRGQMAANVEGVVSSSMAGEKALSRASGPETLHLAFSSPDRNVRTLSPVVEVLTLSMSTREAEDPQRRTIGSIAICHDKRRRRTLASQQLLYKSQCGLGITLGLHQEVEHPAFIVDRPPEIHLPAGNRDEDLIKVPVARRLRPSGPQGASVNGTEMVDPTANGFIAHGDTALCEQILDVPEAHGEAQIHPHHVLDNDRREPETRAWPEPTRQSAEPPSRQQRDKPVTHGICIRLLRLRGRLLSRMPMKGGRASPKSYKQKALTESYALSCPAGHHR
jgi:hypothetical protein